MAERPPAAPSLWPREHGAYMELVFPMASAWLLGRPGVASIALGTAAALAFLAHEPLLVAVGGRGARRKREQGKVARRRLGVLGSLAIAAGAVGLVDASPLVRALVVVPAGVGLLSIALAWTGRERSLLGEVQVALALSSAALPVAVAAGVSLVRSLALVAGWAVGFSVGTIAARGVLLQKRDRGRGLRVSAAAAVVAVLGATGVAATGLAPVAFALAPVPFAVVALALALRPPSPRRMMAIGWGLVGASTATLAVLLAAG